MVIIRSGTAESHTMFLKPTLAVAVVVIFPSLVLAEPGPVRQACENDLKALCGSVQHGGGRLRDCMKEHRAQLSNACKVAIAERMLERKSNKSGNGSAR